MKKFFLSSTPFWVFLFVVYFFVHANAIGGGGLDDEDVPAVASLVKKDQRRSILTTEYGVISAVKVSDGKGGSYHLEFITLEPNALFLPVLLHADMVFYVHTGSARLSWADYDEEDELQHVNLRRGDVYRLHPGTFFFIQSNLEPERQKLRIYAMFARSKENLQEDPSIGPYSSIHDLVLGFNNKVLQAAFNVPEEVIDELKSGSPQPLIVHGVSKSKKTLWEVEAQFMKGLLGRMNYGIFDVNNKGRKTKVFNILKASRDVENCNGWSLTVTKKQLKALRDSDIGVFMVNLTTGAMMGPHWNPVATEIAVVLQGRGMIRVVCSSTASETECKNMRFRVEEGDVFAVPRFHPMAQISFNNETFVFMGFTTALRKNHPQFLAGKRSVLQTLDKLVLAASFKVSNTTIEQLLAPQEESIILECTSCAENEETLMEEEIEKEREEARRREEEEVRKREEEKRREEEEAGKREEEEAKRREEEKKRREEEEEARKREEEEAKRREEEKRRREEEEEEAKRREKEDEARKREEEEAKRREEEKRRREEEEEEEEAKRREKEEEARKREEEEAKRREEEKKRREEAKRREKEEARKREEEEAKRREEEKKRREEEEEEEARKREEEEEEEEARRSEEEEARRREEEEEARRREEEEEARRREEEEEARREEKRRRQEAEQEEEEARQQEEERERQEEGGGEEGEGHHGGEEREARERGREEQEEAARREYEERVRRAREEEAAARGRESEGQEEQERGEGRRIQRKMWKV